MFAPDYAPEDVAEIARKLRERAGLPREATGIVAEGNGARPAHEGQATVAAEDRREALSTDGPRSGAGDAGASPAPDSRSSSRRSRARNRSRRLETR